VSSEAPLFHEVQRMSSSRWVMALVWIGAAAAWVALVVQVVQGASLAENAVTVLVVLLVGVGLPWLFLVVRLEVTVLADRIDIRFPPFRRRTLTRSDIAGFEVRTYEPIREYGGWGLKGWRPGKVAYNISGNRGVDLTLTSGQRLLLGSQRADDLGRAVATLLTP
jgi:hypothetical protein